MSQEQSAGNLTAVNGQTGQEHEPPVGPFKRRGSMVTCPRSSSRHWCLALAILLTLAGSLHAQWTLGVSCDTYPSPSVADWERQPGIAAITIGYSGSGPAQVMLKSSVVSAMTREEIASGLSKTIAFSGPGSVRRDNRDFLNYHDITYSARYREQIVRTNRFPEGAYDLKVRLFPSGDTTKPLAEAPPARFYILSFHRPELRSPADSSAVRVSFPTFQWTPVTTFQGFHVRYRLRLCEVMPRQSWHQAINNRPFHEVVVPDRTTYVYPNTARALEVGQGYVWQVQALDSRNRPLGDFEGKSDVARFDRKQMLVQMQLDTSIMHFNLNRNVTAKTTVTRSGSHYNIKIEVDYPTNATDLCIKVWNQGFQCCTDNSNVGEVASEGDSAKRWVYKVQFTGSYPNGHCNVQYQAVPVMSNHWLARRICDSLQVTYKISGTQYSVAPDLADAKKVVADVYSGAFRASHYLILTIPQSLYAWYDVNQVNSLLNWVGKLAVARNGVVAYVDPGTNQWDLRNWLCPGGFLCGNLATNWGTPSGTDPGSYVLIVGEDNIIGTWDISGFTINWSNSGPTTVVERADFPWADCDGDNIPEFALGRIVGRTAQELERPIRASLLPQSRATTFPTYLFSGRDGSSADCQTSFENAIASGSGYLNARGCNTITTRFSSLGSDAARISAVQTNANARSVVLFTGHGNVNNWDCFSGGNVPGVAFDNVHLPLFVGFTCLSGSYAAGNSIARACLAKQGTRGFLGAVQVSSVGINSQATAYDFWPCFVYAGRQSGGAGLFWLQFSKGVTWSIQDDYHKLWQWEYNYYGDPW
jgi:hypothetical protein